MGCLNGTIFPPCHEALKLLSTTKWIDLTAMVERDVVDFMISMDDLWVMDSWSRVLPENCNKYLTGKWGFGVGFGGRFREEATVVGTCVG